MQMLLGSGGRFALLPSDIAITDITAAPNDALARFLLNSNGTYTCIGSIAPANGTWLRGTGTGADYEARVTVTSGAFTSGTVGSWVSLGVNQAWEVEETGVGVVTAEGTVEIRDAVSGVIFTSCNLTLTAEASL